MQIEVGKSYRTRIGDKVTIDGRNQHHPRYVFMGNTPSGGRDSWTADGRFTSGEHSYDLIAPWEELTPAAADAVMRTFDTGATRHSDVRKLDYEGFLSPLAVERYAEYMQAHRKQADGKLRDSDNWQKGIPLDAYAKSNWRHFFDFWKEHRGIKTEAGIEDALCAILFNTFGYLHELLKAKHLETQCQKTAQPPNCGTSSAVSPSKTS